MYTHCNECSVIERRNSSTLHHHLSSQRSFQRGNSMLANCVSCWANQFYIVTGPSPAQSQLQPSPAVLITPIVSVSNEVSSSSSRENYCVVIACTSNTRHSVLGSGHHISDLVQFNICCLPILFKIYNK